MTLVEAKQELIEHGYIINEKKLHIDPLIYMKLKKQADKIFNDFKKLGKLNIETDETNGVVDDNARLSYSGNIESNLISFTYLLDNNIFLEIFLPNSSTKEGLEISKGYLIGIELKYSTINGFKSVYYNFNMDEIELYNELKKLVKIYNNLNKSLNFEKKHPILTKIGNRLFK